MSKTGNKMIVCQTPESIAMFRLLSLKGRLKLEVLGLRSRISTYAVVKREFGFKGNKKAVLAQLEAHIESLMPPRE